MRVSPPYTFYYDQKGNPVGYDYNKIPGVDEVTEITGVHEYTDNGDEYDTKHEDPQD